jgi:hypothetical protein
MLRPPEPDGVRPSSGLPDQALSGDEPLEFAVRILYRPLGVEQPPRVERMSGQRLAAATRLLVDVPHRRCEIVGDDAVGVDGGDIHSGYTGLFDRLDEDALRRGVGLEVVAGTVKFHAGLHHVRCLAVGDAATAPAASASKSVDGGAGNGNALTASSVRQASTTSAGSA